MILTREGDTVIATLQTEHARASGEVAAVLHDRFFEDGLREKTVAATAIHDCGWEEWERTPTLDSDGRPVDFQEVDNDAHDAIWKRGVQVAEERLGPYAAALINAHGRSFVSEDAEDPRFAWHAGEGGRLTRLCWPDDDPIVREWRVERGHRALRLCDLVALASFAGWEGKLGSAVADEDGRLVECAVEALGPWRVRVSEWPFVSPRMKVKLACWDVTGGWEARRETQRVLAVEPS